jgi:choline dehydrogenase
VSFHQFLRLSHKINPSFFILGWGYDDILKYFIKSEDNEDKEIYTKNPEYHGKGGYQTVEWFPYVDPTVPHLIEAWREKGLDEVDVNADTQIGVTHLQSTGRHGERLSTNGAFIRPIRKKRKNLRILTEAHVTRVILKQDKDHKWMATGVEFQYKNKIRTAIARNEVILSAGAINSPKILMLSGVGPPKHLKRLNIEVKKLLRGVCIMSISFCLFSITFTFLFTSCDSFCSFSAGW